MLAKFDQGHPKTALRSAVVIGGWGIYMLIMAPRAFRVQKLESRNHENIDKEVFFKFLVISKDITLKGRFLNWKFKIYFYSKEFWVIINFKRRTKKFKTHFSD